MRKLARDTSYYIPAALVTLAYFMLVVEAVFASENQSFW